MNEEIPVMWAQVYFDTADNVGEPAPVVCAFSLFICLLFLDQIIKILQENKLEIFATGLFD